MLLQLFALLPLLSLASAGPINKRAASRLIESGRTPGACLSIEGGRQAVAGNNVHSGTPVITLPCATASFWDISKGSGSIILSGANYALDIGTEPGNNGALKVWESYPGSKPQTWYLTDDNRIAQTGGNQCIDQGDNGPQTYECTTGNTNQIYNVRFNDPAPSSSSSSSGPAPSATGVNFNVLPNVPLGSVIRDMPLGGRRIHPFGRPDICLTVTRNFAFNDEAVAFGACFADNENFADMQTWHVPDNGTPGVIRLFSHPTLCLDAGSNPANGVGAKIYACGVGLPQQQWTFKDNTIRTANNQCFNIKKESSGTGSIYYNTYVNTQTWECSTNADPYQAFFILN